ncbi:RRP12-like protein [Nylanderia fulva]|uniref:RRP12-like protein n=1 Tax=Nylanderia fulva TaxID=613905 RepID=UPI0010FB1D46|nr:RRP12-like protein [Nylanderia fulva]
MGKLLRLGSRKKAKRWAKGQSSSSNPTTMKHRKQATGMFFKDFSDTPGITKEDLQKHDAIQGSIQPQFANLDIEDQPESTVYGTATANTFDTFASNYSNCTNVSFGNFLSHFQSTSIMHKEMLAVLSAVTEVIKNHGGTESSTEYFAALMTTLEAFEDETSVAATLSLLGMCLKTVPRAVLNVQFSATSQIFLQILSKYVATENFLILRHCIGCLSVLLRAQQAATWVDPSTKRMLDAILTFTSHAKPKVRKSALHGICVILKGSDIMKSENPPTYHPAAEQIATHCIMQLNNACDIGSSLGVTTILHTLTLLKDVMHQLPKSHVKTICERLLSIMTLKNVLITSCCLQTLHGLFVSRPLEATLPLQTNADIIKALYDYQPSVTDVQPTLAWLAVMQEAHCNLVHTFLNTSSTLNVGSIMLGNIVPRMLNKCTELWLSSKTEVIGGTSNTVKVILQECVAPLCESKERIDKYSSTLSQIISIMHKTLSYQYLEAWQHVFHLVALLFQITGKSNLQGLKDIIKSLGELRDSYNFAYNSDVEYAIGAAIKAMGPQVVLDILPLRADDGTINLKRGWLIPLLKDCITGSTISFFKDVLLPIALTCEEKSKGIEGKTYEFLVPQIWSILPSICNDVSDIKNNFKDIARLLGMVISDRKDLRSPVMAALRKLIGKATRDKHVDDMAELARFAKNYLPILFNLYMMKPNGTDEEGQRLAAFETIKIYLTIMNSDLANEMFERALSKLDEPNANDFFKESVYDLIRVLIGYTDVDKLKKYYDMCVPVLQDDTKQKEQKKAYRFLEEICGSDRKVCKQFLEENRRGIQKILITSTTSVINASRGTRLRCLTHLVKLHPQLEKTKFLEAIVPEAVLGVKDINARCRNTAYQLLNEIAQKFLNNSEYLKDYTDMLMVGLGGEQNYISATLLALASLTYHYNGSLDMETIKEILEHVWTILTSPTREVVESALSYVKVYLNVMPTSVVASTLPQMINALSQMNEDCKRHFRQKVRDIFTKLIRKYGIGPISSMIPTSDVILHKRLKNINKIEDAKRKKRELERAKKLENDDMEFNAKRTPKSIEEILADSDEEFEATENEESAKDKKRTSRKDAWIQENEENIVDLIDPAAARNITTTQPGVSNPTKIPMKKVKDHGFKTAPDGRLIIVDGNEKDSDTEEKSKKKFFLQNKDSEEDDYEDEDDVSMTTKNVDKKRKYSESMSDVMSLKSQSTSRYQAGGSGIHRPLKTRKVEREAGSEYRAVKGRGDIKKKGKPDPYAYLPLTRSALNKRKKKKNAGKFQSIVSGAKKGARKGMKNKRKRH